MFKDLEPYPGYVDRPGAAVVSVPEQWGVRRLKTVLREVDRRSTTGTERLLSLRAAHGLVDHEGAGGRPIAAAALTGFKVVEAGDLVMNRMRAATGVFGLAKSRGLVSPDYAVFGRTAPCELGYLLALLRTPQVAHEMRRRSRGMGTGESGFLRLYSDSFGAMSIPWPTGGEQVAIVRYLAHAHRRIDRAIAAKRKLIGLLEEQSQAITNQAVTRGLDASVPLKDTGIPWLGQVPAPWETWPLGRLAHIGNGSTPSRSNPEYWAGGYYPWLNSAHANRDRVTGSDQFVTARALAQCHLPIVRPGSVLVAITGQGKTRGKAALLEIEATINQHLAYITPSPALVHSAFLQRSLQAAYPELRRISDDSGSTKGALTCQDLKAFRVPLPPIDEQRAIVARMDAETATADAAINRARREIDLLGEFRTRLIADVVTGQVDVRHIGDTLPDVDPEELADDGGTAEDDLVDEATEFLEDVDV